MFCGIYSIKNTMNGKRYIGQSFDIDRRTKHHFANLICGRHVNSHLQGAFNKYGADCFEFCILELVSEEMLDIRERAWISYYKSDHAFFGYNMDGGGRSNRIMSIITKRKMSVSRRNRPPVSDETRLKLSISGKGRIVSDATKKKLSESNKGQGKGRKLPESVRQKMSASRMGRVFSDESRKKMSESRMGYVPSEAMRKKLSDANKGKVVSEETKKKISLTLKGRLMSSDTRKKLSSSVKTMWAKRKNRSFENV